MITGAPLLLNEPSLGLKDRSEFGASARFHLLPVGEELLDEMRIHVQRGKDDKKPLVGHRTRALELALPGLPVTITT